MAGPQECWQLQHDDGGRTFRCHGGCIEDWPQLSQPARGTPNPSGETYSAARTGATVNTTAAKITATTAVRTLGSPRDTPRRSDRPPLAEDFVRVRVTASPRPCTVGGFRWGDP